MLETEQHTLFHQSATQQPYRYLNGSQLSSARRHLRQLRIFPRDLKREGHPEGKKVKGSILAEALRRARLREYVPSSVSSHMLADAAEALLVYAWLSNCLTLEESVTTLEKNQDVIEGLSQLLQTGRRRIRLS